MKMEGTIVERVVGVLLGIHKDNLSYTHVRVTLLYGVLMPHCRRS